MLLLALHTLSLLILNELLRDNAGDRDSKFCILTVYGHEKKKKIVKIEKNKRKKNESLALVYSH